MRSRGSSRGLRYHLRRLRCRQEEVLAVAVGDAVVAVVAVAPERVPLEQARHLQPERLHKTEHLQQAEGRAQVRAVVPAEAAVVAEVGAVVAVVGLLPRRLRRFSWWTFV